MGPLRVDAEGGRVTSWLPFLAVAALVVLSALPLERPVPVVAPPEPELARAESYPWCPECVGLPDLGTEPRVRRAR
jgi:hypothetical protein